ncbi:MAG: RNA polymerase sigma factor [Selenomonadaceae bacterium]
MGDFEFLYEKYNKEIFLFILRLMNFKYDLAEELTQETFYQVYISMDRFKGACNIKTWICSIAKNVCYKYFRKNPIEKDVPVELVLDAHMESFAKTPCELLELKEKTACIKREILHFDPKYRDVLCYRLYFDLPFEEIGKLMQINANSAKVLYHRGRKELIARLEEIKNEE